VVAALAVVAKQKADDRLSVMIRRGADWLKLAQNPDGSWGGGVRTRGSVEETSLALQALLAAGGAGSEEVTRGFDYLQRTGGNCAPSPIGFYFAKLWYFEKLYPLIFQVGAGAQCAGVHRFPR
jgi:squalene-hopene/tetraprenyl-beta-curcumene cyclase